MDNESTAAEQGGEDSLDIDSPDLPVLTSRGLARFLNVGDKWVVQNRTANRIPGHFKAGAGHRFRKADIERQIITTGNALLPKAKVVSLGLNRKGR